MTDLVTKFSRRSDLHQSPMYADVMADIGWATFGDHGKHVFIRHLGPLSVAKIQRPQVIDLPELNQLRKQHRIITLYLEPGLSTPTGRLGVPSEPFAHSTTSLLDLSLSESKILASFNQTTRRHIAQGAKDPLLQVRTIPLSQLTSADLADFFALWRSWGQLKHVTGHPEPFLRSVLSHFALHGHLSLAYCHAVPCAGLLTLMHDHVATYYTAFSTPQGNAHFAPTLLTWQAMQTAKENVCDIFDFGGIYDPRYPKLYRKWQGFTQFKAGFRPTVITYPPTYLKLFW